MAASVPLLAFNDVYRVSQRYVPQPGCPAPASAFPPDAEIKVGQFAQLVYDLRATWPPRKKGEQEGGSDDDGRDGLFLFAGDVFSPSVESSVTRGSHMVSTPSRRAKRVGAAFLPQLSPPSLSSFPSPSTVVSCWNVPDLGLGRLHRALRVKRNVPKEYRRSSAHTHTRPRARTHTVTNPRCPS